MATFAEMFDEEIGKRVGEGHELGLADQLERSFSPQSVVPPVSHDAHHGTPGVDGTLTSTFGPRVDPINGKPGFHQGVDIAAPEGTPIHAVRGGRVIFAGPHAGHGNLVEIDHGDGVVTRYAHCSHIDVMQGQQVTEDEVIGEVGSTGHSTGPHLHFEVKVDGRPVDPLSWFDSPVPSDP
jgi:murein DD-endopeptidase MepM/ murein hydrolase activator NlpD